MCQVFKVSQELSLLIFRTYNVWLSLFCRQRKWSLTAGKSHYPIASTQMSCGLQGGRHSHSLSTVIFGYMGGKINIHRINEWFLWLLWSSSKKQVSWEIVKTSFTVLINKFCSWVCTLVTDSELHLPEGHREGVELKRKTSFQFGVNSLVILLSPHD
jgi:hypothetical protein